MSPVKAVLILSVLVETSWIELSSSQNYANWDVTFWKRPYLL